MAETPETALSGGFAPIGGPKTEVDAHHSADRAQHKKEDAALDPHVMEKITVGIRTQLSGKQSNADLRSPAQAHDSRNE